MPTWISLEHIYRGVWRLGLMGVHGGRPRAAYAKNDPIEVQTRFISQLALNLFIHGQLFCSMLDHPRPFFEQRTRYALTTGFKTIHKLDLAGA